MELNELKKSWTTLDHQLRKSDIVDEKQIGELISNYQSGVKNGLTQLSNLQKLSLFVGVVCFLALAVVLILGTEFFSIVRLSAKEVVMAGYVVVSLFGGFLWDWQQYRFCRGIQVYEMPTIEVIRRVNKFRKKLKYELIILCVWILIFISLYYWVRDFYTQPLTVQVVFVLGSLILTGIVMGFLYKKILYKRLNDIEKNLKELKELEG